jgi:hypothetical protein
MPQAEHRLIIETTKNLTREEIVAQLAPIPEEQVKYLYERRLYEHGLGPISITATMRAEPNAMCGSD